MIKKNDRYSNELKELDNIVDKIKSALTDLTEEYRESSSDRYSAKEYDLVAEKVERLNAILLSLLEELTSGSLEE